MRHKTLPEPVALAEEITGRARIKGVPDADYYRLLTERGLQAKDELEHMRNHDAH